MLEVAGCADLESLGRADVDELVRELKRANGILKITKRAPRKADVAKWVRTARNLAGIEDKPKVAAGQSVLRGHEHRRSPYQMSDPDAGWGGYRL